MGSKASKPAKTAKKAKKAAAKKPAAKPQAREAAPESTHMSKKNKSKPRASNRLTTMDLLAPVAAAVAAPKLLLGVQKITDAASAEKDKTPLFMAGGAIYLSRTKYRRYAPALLVAAAVAFRRRQHFLGKLPEDPKSSEFILSENTPSPK